MRARSSLLVMFTSVFDREPSDYFITRSGSSDTVCSPRTVSQASGGFDKLLRSPGRLSRRRRCSLPRPPTAPPPPPPRLPPPPSAPTPAPPPTVPARRLRAPPPGPASTRRPPAAPPRKGNCWQVPPSARRIHIPSASAAALLPQLAHVSLTAGEHMRGNAPDNKLLEELRKVHNFFLRSPFRGALKVNNELLEMYAKCAAMPHARRTFDNRPERNMDSWHIMIDGYSVNGLGDEALRLFKLMKECMAPTSHTFVLVLNACASPRFDDTNPEAERKEYIDHIQEIVHWMRWEPYKVTYTRDYFQALYEHAVQLIRKGLAYVDHQTAEDIKEYRENKMNSPRRHRPIEESLAALR
ncbi:uncharacterized protein LOC133896009 [Phragmites australis]|uniref:uncharacterized protein LOC133896009 n=1 Tax=Phragmites australis TaxID=29695 RepID=UPI002D797894|nr:uncharacterized protein LOC133896009 [Phragmites australis]